MQKQMHTALISYEHFVSELAPPNVRSQQGQPMHIGGTLLLNGEKDTILHLTPRTAVPKKNVKGTL